MKVLSLAAKNYRSLRDVAVADDCAVRSIRQRFDWY